LRKKRKRPRALLVPAWFVARAKPEVSSGFFLRWRDDSGNSRATMSAPGCRRRFEPLFPQLWFPTYAPAAGPLPSTQAGGGSRSGSSVWPMADDTSIGPGFQEAPQPGRVAGHELPALWGRRPTSGANARQRSWSSPRPATCEGRGVGNAKVSGIFRLSRFRSGPVSYEVILGMPAHATVRRPCRGPFPGKLTNLLRRWGLRSNTQGAQVVSTAKEVTARPPFKVNGRCHWPGPRP